MTDRPQDVGARWRCRANGDLATELSHGALLKLRLDEPIPRLFLGLVLWFKRTIYVDERAWERVATGEAER